MRGRAIGLSVPRQMMIDFLYFARGVPTVPVQKHMSVAALAAARAACNDRPRWTAIFTKAFALVAEEVPQLRRAYVKFPWPHLYEYPTSKANIMIERDYQGEQPSVRSRSRIQRISRCLLSEGCSSKLQPLRWRA